MNKQAVSRTITKVFKGFQVPQDIEPLCDVGEEVSTGREASVELIWQRTQSVFKTGMHPFVSIAIRHRGELIMNRSIGYARLDPIVPEASTVGCVHTPVCMFSASKAITAMLVHKLAEDDKLDLLAPVAEYLPEFGQGGKENINIMQMLSHRGGFPFVDQDGVDASLLQRPEEIYRLICELDCIDSDGRIQAYHALSSGFIIAELIKRLTGKTIREYLDKIIRKPLGVSNLDYGYRNTASVPHAYNYNTGAPRIGPFMNMLQRLMAVRFEDIVELSNEESFLDSVVPSGNAYGTAEEMTRFYQMLMNDGFWGDQQLFQRNTIQAAVREAGPARIDRGLGLPMRFSAGFMLGGKPFGMYGKNTHHAYGHLGLSNILCWADPQRDIAVSILTTGKPIVGNHLVSLPRLVLNIAKEFEQ